MRNVRVWYKKFGSCRYISHLDVNRAVMRAMQMSGLPFWHTEGFNSRMYVSFALSLSLGFTGECECADMKLTVEDVDNAYVIKRLNECLPDGIEVYDITEPKMKPAEIAYAEFEIFIKSDDMSSDLIHNKLTELLESEHIFTEKKTKKGDIKQVDIKKHIAKYQTILESSFTVLKIMLPAGNNVNINPTLLTDILEKECGTVLYCDVRRGRLYNNEGELFR